MLKGEYVNMHATLAKLIESGMQVDKVQFHAAVNNADNIPENYFSAFSNVPSRRAKMWLTPTMLICLQKNIKNEDVYFWVPTSTCIFGHFTKQDQEDENDTVEIKLPMGYIESSPKRRGRPPKTEA